MFKSVCLNYWCTALCCIPSLVSECVHLTFNSTLVGECVCAYVCVWLPPNTWLSHFFPLQFVQKHILLAQNVLLMIILAPNLFVYSLKWIYFRNCLKSKFSRAVVIVGYRSGDFPHFSVYQLILSKMNYCYFCHLSNGTALSRPCFYEIMPGKTLFKVWLGLADVRLPQEKAL